MSAWKDLERRVCRALGGERAGPIGAAVSDCIGVPFSVEVKRSSRPGPPVLSAWVIQAREQSKREGKPWLLVVAGPNDRDPICVEPFSEFIARENKRKEDALYIKELELRLRETHGLLSIAVEGRAVSDA